MSLGNDENRQCFTSEVTDNFVNLNQLARVVVASDALLRMTREPSSVVGVGRSPDPVEHAREETAGLLEAFPIEERPALQQYLDALQQFQQRLPVQ